MYSSAQGIDHLQVTWCMQLLLTDRLETPCLSHLQEREQEMVPEEVGKRAAYALLGQIHTGGTVDSFHQVISRPKFT